MKKYLVLMMSLVIFIIAGCSGESELEGKTLGLSMSDPTVSPEERENADIKFTSNTPVFDFESANDVTLTLNGSTYQGEYTLEDDQLSVTVEDGDSSLTLDFTNFEKSEDEYYSYSGEISNGALNEGEETTQLTNIHRNFGLGEHYLFLEEA